MQVSRKKTKKTWLFVLGLLVLAMVGFGVTSQHKTAHASLEGQQEKAPTPEVEVQILKEQEQRLWSEFSGRLEAIDHVEIRPRVSGTITKVLFEEGAMVKQGQPLFVIDPRSFEASVATAEAAVSAAKSQAELARVELKRAKKLAKANHVSKSRVDERNRDYQVALSSIKGARAQLKQAKLDLEYAHIEAPISGRISRAEMTLGNVIEAGPNAPVLTSIVSDGEIYGEFDVDEQTYLRAVRGSEKGKMPVEMTLASDKSVTYRGIIHSFDNQLDTTSGTIRARAIFKNTDGALMPGMYANVRMGGASKERIILINDKAISTDQSKKYVYVVSPEGEVEYREVVLGRSVEGQRVVLQGLRAGEQVMVNSLQRVRPGMIVEPIDVAIKSSDERGVIVGEAEADNVAQNQKPSK